MATESSLWKWLSKARQAFGPLLHIRRVENAISVGDPDVEGCFKGGQFNLELKYAKRPTRSSTVLRFGSEVKPEQVEWAEDRLNAGGAAAFLIQVGEGPERVVYLLHGIYGRDLAKGWTESELASLALICKTPGDVLVAAPNQTKGKL